MGNSQSLEVSLEEFKDKLFGISIYLLSKEINNHLEFKPTDECDGDNLPESNLDSTNLYETVLAYYNNSETKNTDKDLDGKIEEYVNKNILNSKENVTRFYKALIDKLSSSKVVSKKRATSPKRKKLAASVPTPGTQAAIVDTHLAEKFGRCVLSESVKRSDDEYDGDNLEYDECDTQPN